jgi:hypothetical protein
VSGPQPSCVAPKEAFWGRRPLSLLDVSTDGVEDQIDAADVFQGVVVEVDELMSAVVERLLAVGGTSVIRTLPGSLAMYKADPAAVRLPELRGRECRIELQGHVDGRGR